MESHDKNRQLNSSFIIKIKVKVKADQGGPGAQPLFCGKKIG